jgi:hypothetical protein
MRFTLFVGHIDLGSPYWRGWYAMKKLLTVVLLVAVVAAIAKMVMMKQEWSGLSETQVRDKLDAGLSRKVDDVDKRQEIADKVVTAMKDKGVIREEPIAEAPVAAADAAAPEIEEAG